MFEFPRIESNYEFLLMAFFYFSLIVITEIHTVTALCAQRQRVRTKNKKNMHLTKRCSAGARELEAPRAPLKRPLSLEPLPPAVPPRGLTVIFGPQIQLL